MLRAPKAVQLKIVPCPFEIRGGAVHGDRTFRPAQGCRATKSPGITIQVQKIFPGGAFPYHHTGIPVIGKKPGIQKAIQIDQETQISFPHLDARFLPARFFVTRLSVLPAGTAALQVHIFRRNPQNRGHSRGHLGKPLRSGLPAHIFSHDQVAGVPVDHRPHLRDIPIVKPETFNILPGETLSHMLIAFQHAIGQNFGVMPGFFRRHRIRLRFYNRIFRWGHTFSQRISRGNKRFY